MHLFQLNSYKNNFVITIVAKLAIIMLFLLSDRIENKILNSEYIGLFNAERVDVDT